MIARASTARCFWPPERSLGYLSTNCAAGASPTRSSASATGCSQLGRGRRRARGSAADRPTAVADRHRRVQRRVRVLEDDLQPPAQRPELGLAESRVISSPLELDRPAVAATRPSSVRPSVVLPRARLADDAEHLAAAELEADTPSTAFTDPASWPRRRSTNEPRSGEVRAAGRGPRAAASPLGGLAVPSGLLRDRDLPALERLASPPSGISSSGPCSQQRDALAAGAWPHLDRVLLRRRPASRSGSAGGSGTPAAGRSDSAARPGM